MLLRRCLPSILLAIAASPSAVRLVSLRPGRNGNQGIACFLIGNMQVLVGDEVKELVLDDRSADGAAGAVAVQLGILVRVGNSGVVLEEEWRGVDPVSAAAAVETAVDGIGARSGAHVDVRAAGRALLRVVHRSVDADLLQRLRCRRGDCIADGEIDR